MAHTIRNSFSRCTIGTPSMGGGGDASMDAFYDYATINDRMLGFADPVKVQEGQRAAACIC